MTQGVMDKSRKALASAQILLDAGDTDGATNRAYYSMFEAATAALTWAGIGTAQNPPHKSHSGLISSFGRHIVQTGRLPAEFGRSFNRLQDLRLTADYLAEPVPFDNAKWAIEAAEAFVAGVSQLLAQSAPEPTL